VLAAINPWLGAEFLARTALPGFLVLGAVFLVVTGAEALYADLGHFGRRPIRLAWFCVVLPALLCSYFGQGALLLRHPEQAYHPFYAMAPRWSLVPFVILATIATVIASQAVISGAFSLTRQAIRLGYLPRLRIVHTSEAQIGQIYIPEVNRFLFVTTLALVFGFASSSRLAAAYGVAVTSTMLMTTILFYVMARHTWRWRLLAAAAPVTVFLLMDLAFLSANLSKILHGAWFPIAVGAIVLALFTTWNRGRAILARRLAHRSMTVDEFVAIVQRNDLNRVPGKAVSLTGNPRIVPPALLHNLKHNRIVHAQAALLTVVTEEVPRVEASKKVEVEDLGGGIYRVLARYGFMEDPNVPHILALARGSRLDFKPAEVSFFLGRERLLSRKQPLMSRWRLRLFDFMSRNALDATAFFRIPPGQVVELGTQVII